MITSFIIALGALIGTFSRYLIFTFPITHTYLNQASTMLLINNIGSFSMGFVYFRPLNGTLVGKFLILGILGAFTNFSAFAAAAASVQTKANTMAAFLYIFISLASACISFYVGALTAKLLG